MRQDQHGNEDIMTEAVSLLNRIECREFSWNEPTVLGINAQDWLFVYLGSDPMYRFDGQGRLRRALVRGRLFRTSGNSLAVLDRESEQLSPENHLKSVSILSRTDLSFQELEAFRQQMHAELTELSGGLCAERVTRQFPNDAEGLVELFQQRLQGVLKAKEFLAPAIVRR